MRILVASRAQVRLWTLLTMAFVVVGCSFGFAILKLSVDRYSHDYRYELENLASVAALSIDSKRHESIQSTNDLQSDAYRSISVQLADIKRRIPEIRYIYTLREAKDGYIFVVDPTPPGDHDSDGIDDKSYVGDPYPEISTTAKAAFSQGISTVESEPTTDRWGTFISAFAPIKDAHGKVVAVLGIDRLANDLVSHNADMRNYGICGILLIAAMGAFFGWSFTRKMSRSAENRGWLRYLTGSNRVYRTTLFEVVLGSIALIAFLGAIQNLTNDQRISSNVREANKRIGVLQQAQAKISDAKLGRTTAHIALLDIRAIAQSEDFAWLYTRVDVAAREAAILSARVLDSLETQIKSEVEQTTRRREADVVRIAEGRNDLNFLVLISATLAICVLVIIRAASIQQQDLIAAQTDSEWHQVAYRQVVENLPIGLFMYADGEITFSNETWDRQCALLDATERTSGIRASLAGADRERYFEILDSSQATSSSFEFQYSLHFGEEVRTFETRGVPLLNSDGEFECLLGFTNDVTQRAKVQDLLKGKNREVQSKNRMLSKAVAELEENFEAMVQTLVKAVEAKDIYTAGHSERVMLYSMRIGDRLRLQTSEMRTLQMGTLIHDIGKIGIPDEILTKPEGLTEEEYRIVRTHSERGAQMVEGIPIFQDCVPIVRWHHERLDGSGYPSGLMGQDIPLLVRISAVADVFDALTSSRAYREAMSIKEACEVLHLMAVKNELDPKLVAILTDIVEKEGVLWLSEKSRAA